ncbi:hypothetical protein JCM10207_003796 [Rhodosporidiobolus poonsookiae]
MAAPVDYPSTASFSPTPRFLAVLSTFASMHATDPAGHAADYHATLEAYVRKLSLRSTDERLQQGPGEALLLAANCQHIRRWERPRGDYAEGLSGYKMWRTALNRFHADIAQEVMLQSGYSAEEDQVLLQRVRDLLLKKTLARPPLPPVAELKDPEAHLFEDAICLTFLRLEFVKFSEPYLAAPTSPETASPHVNPSKLGGIVAKTWAKVSSNGREVAVEELVPILPEELKTVVVESSATSR